VSRALARANAHCHSTQGSCSLASIQVDRFMPPMMRRWTASRPCGSILASRPGSILASAEASTPPSSDTGPLRQTSRDEYSTKAPSPSRPTRSGPTLRQNVPASASARRKTSSRTIASFSSDFARDERISAGPTGKSIGAPFSVTPTIAAISTRYDPTQGVVARPSQRPGMPERAALKSSTGSLIADGTHGSDDQGIVGGGRRSGH
jgi:hypothetical protein